MGFKVIGLDVRRHCNVFSGTSILIFTENEVVVVVVVVAADFCFDVGKNSKSKAFRIV